MKRLSAIPRITRHPNIEAEVVAPLLFAAAGLPWVPATPRRCRATGDLYIETPFLRASVPPEAPLPTAARARHLVPRIARHALAELAVVDILMGNADRSLANVLLHEVGDRVVALPIDHNAAFLAPDRDTSTLRLAGFVGGFCGVAATARDNRYRRWQLRRCGTLRHILDSSPLYQRAFCAQRMGDLAPVAASVLERLTAGVVDDLFDAAAAMLSGVVETRRLEAMAGTLQKRRAEIARAVARSVARVHAGRGSPMP